MTTLYKKQTSNPPHRPLPTMESNNVDASPLQKHAAFFDKNNDGIIYPRETYKGLRAIGCGVGLSFFGAIFINLTLSLPTKPADVFPSLFLPIYVSNIQKGKHGSDTDAYDDEGRFVISKFEDIWKKHAGTTRNALTSSELNRMLKANRERNDIAGWIGSWVEWRILYHLAKDKDGLLQKETVRGVYDGSLFSKLEDDRKKTP